MAVVGEVNTELQATATVRTAILDNLHNFVVPHNADKSILFYLILYFGHEAGENLKCQPTKIGKILFTDIYNNGIYSTCIETHNPNGRNKLTHCASINLKVQIRKIGIISFTSKFLTKRKIINHFN